MIRPLAGLMAAPGLARNSIFSAGQNLFATLCLLLVYKIVIYHEGLAGLGLWSLLIVFGGVAASFDISGASALARFVARHDHEFAGKDRVQTVHTVLLTSFAINLVFAAILTALAPLFVERFLEPDQLRDAWGLIPFVAILMIILPLAVGIGSAIDGIMRADLRAKVSSFAVAINLLVALVAIPRLGIVGLGLAQCAQQFVVVVVGWTILRRNIPGMGFLPVKWDRTIFRSTSGYAVRANVVGILSLLFEPLVRFIVNFHGGTAAVGLYELAFRITTQLRQLAIGAATPLLPAFASFKNTRGAQFREMAWRAQRYAIIAALAILLLSLLAAPVVSALTLGYVMPQLLRFTAVLAFGWSIGLFALPLYLVAQGHGILRWNMLTLAAHAGGVIAASALLGSTLGTFGILLGVAAGLAGGALVNILGNSRQFKLAPFPKILWLQMLACSVLMLISSVAYLLLASEIATLGNVALAEAGVIKM